MSELDTQILQYVSKNGTVSHGQIPCGVDCNFSYSQISSATFGLLRDSFLRTLTRNDVFGGEFYSLTQKGRAALDFTAKKSQEAGPKS